MKLETLFNQFNIDISALSVSIYLINPQHTFEFITLVVLEDAHQSAILAVHPSRAGEVVAVHSQEALLALQRRSSLTEPSDRVPAAAPELLDRLDQMLHKYGNLKKIRFS